MGRTNVSDHGQSTGAGSHLSSAITINNPDDFIASCAASSSEPRIPHANSLIYHSLFSVPCSPLADEKMKRSRDALEGHCDKQRRRQECVSCQFCRTKKLKCDRQFPCSNCRARRLTCASSGRMSSELSEGVANFS